MNLLRGDVWSVDLDPTRGGEIKKRRPCVIISQNDSNRSRNTVVVVPLSTSPVVRPPITVAVNFNGRSGVAVIDQIAAKAKERFGSRIGQLNPDEMKSIERGLKQILGLQ